MYFFVESKHHTARAAIVAIHASKLVMDVSGYKFKSEAFKRQLAEEVAKAVASARAEAVLLVLAARDIPVSDARRTTILACTDLSMLKSWIQRAATASSIDDVVRETDFASPARSAIR